MLGCRLELSLTIPVFKSLNAQNVQKEIRPSCTAALEGMNQSNISDK